MKYLGAEWVAALGAAAARSAALRAATDEIELSVQVTTTDGPDGDVSFSIVVDADGVRVAPGTADEPTVVFTQSYATAVAIARGERSAQDAFLAGDLRLGGDVTVLVRHQAAFAGLDDLFAAVRDDTDW